MIDDDIPNFSRGIRSSTIPLGSTSYQAVPERRQESIPDPVLEFLESEKTELLIKTNFIESLILKLTTERMILRQKPRDDLPDSVREIKL